MGNKQKKVLSVLYQCRLLNISQIHQLALYNTENKNGGIEYSKKIVQGMVKDGYIKKTRKGSLYLYSITAKGVGALKSEPIKRIGNAGEELEVTKTPTQISLADKNIPHQIAQNEFIVKLSAILQQADVSWWYSDDAFINKDFLGVFRPDGVLCINDRYYFLEMDMGTEQTKALQSKWNGYRKLFSNGYINEKYGTVQILFLIDGVENTKKRINLVEKTIQEIMPDLANNQVLDVLIDTPDHLLAFMQEEIYEQILKCQFPKWKVDLVAKGYKFYNGSQIPTENCKFQTLCMQRDDQGVLVIDNNVEEYLVDDGRYHRQSVIYNTRNYRYNMLTLKASKGREIKYVIIVEENTYSKELQEATWVEDGILLTTVERFTENQGAQRFFKQKGNHKFIFDKEYKTLGKEGE